MSQQTQAVQKHASLFSVLSSLGSPLDILLGIANEIDYFELELPFKLAERGVGLDI